MVEIPCRMMFLLLKSSDSSLWKHMVRHWPIIDEHCYWVVGTGQNVSFWNDAWVLLGIKLASVVSQVPPELHGLRVCELVGEGGYWNLFPIQ